jgi:hypothetical protein
MKQILFVSLILSTCIVRAADVAQASAEVQEKFAPGGFVRLHLSPGGYTIRAGDPNTIHISYHAANSDQVKQVKVKIRAGSTSADVFISDTPHNNFRATIEVPARTDLRVRLFAGEVVVEELEGDKDVEVDAGRIEIRIPNPDLYGRRDASVHAGSIEGSAFSVSKGGLFRSWEQKGPGKYRLHAHVATGEISLVRAP